PRPGREGGAVRIRPPRAGGTTSPGEEPGGDGSGDDRRAVGAPHRAPARGGGPGSARRSTDPAEMRSPGGRTSPPREDLARGDKKHVPSRPRRQKLSSAAPEGGPSARNGGHQTKEHDEAVSEHRSEMNSDDEDFLDPNEEETTFRKATGAEAGGSTRRRGAGGHGKHSKIVQSEPEAGGAARRRELRAEAAQFLPCGAVTLAGRAGCSRPRPGGRTAGGTREESAN
ncbi:hypothetical protein THAOC_37588, partial [Thalassiosira oceanica]